MRVESGRVNTLLAENQASSLHPLLPEAPVPDEVDARIRDDSMRCTKIRAFFARFTAIAGGSAVAIPFRIALDSFDQRWQSLRRELGSSPALRHAGFVVAGRPTPEQLQEVVGELWRLHPEHFAQGPEASRSYLRDNGVGIDCAGIVQQALFASRDFTPEAGRRHFGLRPLLDENLANLGHNAAFMRLDDPSQIRSGDLVILGPPADDEVGHTAIVAAAEETVLDEHQASLLRSRFPGLSTPGHRVTKLYVDSSWGGGAGPEERIWIYDHETNRWGELGGTRVDGVADRSPHGGPWDHPLSGMYHPLP